MSVVFDASTVLTILFDEPGAQAAVAVSKGALVSTVNVVEIIEKFASKVGDPASIAGHLRRLEIETVPFSARQAARAAALKPGRGTALSIADRACLALALDRGLPILTADPEWAGLDVGVEIRLLR